MDWDNYVQENICICAAEVTDVAKPYLKEYPEIFDKKDFDQILEQRLWDHAIDLTPGSKPINCKIYPLNLLE